MPYTLKGRNVLVTGGSRGLGALICEKFAAEGSNVAVNYVSSKDRAEEVAKKVESYGVKAICIRGDCGSSEDNTRLVKETVKAFGGIDIIIANAGWTRFAKFGDLNDLSLDEWNKCWASNVMAHLQLMQAAGPIFDANDEGGVYIITSSVAGISTGGSSMGYSVTKAAGLHLMKCIAATQGSKVRMNAVLPGLLLTEWGLRYSEDRIKELKDKAVLKTETDLDDCADMVGEPE
ncbi:hypothetical protein LTR64_006886 [Lithohypha guttulata]|uniref:Uncharacterized protein n=1 Tax=Lithohypha guttulata TaxID=1690604 RepID=A0AAN7T6G3_9EURO|nr:hypothetical protein LTR51_004556 [Lithohypha guttulata]KAK5091163.1 hypothetical protein LTR05_001343 [Lithohypha guttulata]